MSEWIYILANDETIWARTNAGDPYGYTREVIFDGVRNEVSVRMQSNDRATCTAVVQVAAPVDVLAEVLRRAGWTVTPPKE